MASCTPAATYIDCDVEEPNGHLFFKPENVKIQEVTAIYPLFQKDLCQNCRACVQFCKFHALAYVGKAPMVFKDVCHGCGGCQLVCPNGAVSMGTRPVGVVETGIHDGVTVVTGRLNLGEASAVPVIHASLEAGCSAELTVIDCPPGSSCSVMESVAQADYCLLVVEPTAFGFHNFQMVHQLVALMGKPFGMVINKEDGPYPPLVDYCADNGLSILARFAYRPDLAKSGAEGKIAVEEDGVIAQSFRQLLSDISREVAP
ncbi:MAG: 4Fe-4S binding protein [Eubacteriales bacterium]